MALYALFYRLRAWIAIQLSRCNDIISRTASLHNKSSGGSPVELKVTNPTCTVLVAGPRGSGKTSWIYRLKLGLFIDATPTYGLMEESFVLHHPGDDEGPNHRLHLVDPSFRVQPDVSALMQVYRQVRHLALVVDATNASQLREHRNTLIGLMVASGLEHLERTLIVLNKYDLPGAMTTGMARDILQLPSHLVERCQFVSTSCLNGYGIERGLRWLLVGQGDHEPMFKEHRQTPRRMLGGHHSQYMPLDDYSTHMTHV